jgi:hypothetical protein
MMKSALPILACCLLHLLTACSVFEDNSVRPVNAEIEDVRVWAVGSVMIEIEVKRNSSADHDCSFSVKVQATDGSYTDNKLISDECGLEDQYKFIINGLDKTKTYTFQLRSGGRYDIGGDKDRTTSFDVGDPWTFTFP